MYHKIFKLPVVGIFFRMAKTIPIAPAHEDKELMDKAFDRVAQLLERGEVVCIFPEGKLTSDGEMNEFKKGIEVLIERTPVPVIPLALKGLWGSWFSRYNGRPMKGLPRKFMAKIGLKAGEPIAPENVKREHLFETVKNLKDTID
jgi:1-acyl-sn-glycerol-3-phosphate acyltransferase